MTIKIAKIPVNNSTDILEVQMDLLKLKIHNLNHLSIPSYSNFYSL